MWSNSHTCDSSGSPHTMPCMSLVAERISARQLITQAGYVSHMANINTYVCVTPGISNESTMRMLASPRRALCSDVRTSTVRILSTRTYMYFICTYVSTIVRPRCAAPHRQVISGRSQTNWLFQLQRET